MEQTSTVTHSEHYEEILAIIRLLKLEKTEGDSYDHASVAMKIDKLFFKNLQKSLVTSSIFSVGDMVIRPELGIKDFERVRIIRRMEDDGEGSVWVELNDGTEPNIKHIRKARKIEIIFDQLGWYGLLRFMRRRKIFLPPSKSQNGYSKWL